MVGTWNRRTLGIALLAAVTGLGLLAKPLVGVAQSSQEADGARLLKGALDLHFHMDPWTPDRVRGAGIAEVLAARASGMRGLVIKDHNEPTAPLAYHLRQVVPGLELYGGFVLNPPNGGAPRRASSSWQRKSGANRDVSSGCRPATRRKRCASRKIRTGPTWQCRAMANSSRR